MIKLELQLAERSSQIGLLREEKELGREMEDRARNAEQEVTRLRKLLEGRDDAFRQETDLFERLAAKLMKDIGGSGQWVAVDWHSAQWRWPRAPDEMVLEELKRNDRDKDGFIPIEEVRRFFKEHHQTAISDQ